MSETIASMAVNVVGDTNQFGKEMRKGREELSGFQKGVSSLHDHVVGLAGALAAGFAAKFSFDEFHKAVREVDELAKAVDTIGGSTIRLDGLERAAEIAGATREGLVKGIEHMERAVGGGDSALGNLHLDIEKLRLEKPEKVFMDIADAIKSVDNAYDRSEYVKGIFGKGGAELMPTLLKGSEGLRMETALQRGYSREDAAGVEQLNDESKRLGQTFSELGHTLAIEFGPTLAHVAAALNHDFGGTTKEDVDPWKARLDKLTDAEFAKFATDFSHTDRSTGWNIHNERQAFGGKHWQSEYEAVKSYLGDDAANPLETTQAYGQPAMDKSIAIRGIEAAIRERNLRIDDETADKQAKYLAATVKPGMRGNAIGDGLLGTMATMASNMAMREFERKSQYGGSAFPGLESWLPHLWKDVPTNKKGEPEKDQSWLDQPGFLNGVAKSIHDSPLGWMFRNTPDAFAATLFGDDAFKPKQRTEFHDTGPNGRSPGFTAIDANSAEGFRQEARSRLADSGRNNVAEKHLSEAQKQTGKLDKIDASINRAQKLEIMNIA